MAGKNPIVGIKFGVDPQSAGIIKTQLEDLSGKIKLDKLQINIDTNHFNAQLNKLQQDIKKKLGEIKIDLVTKTAGQGGNGNSSEASDAEKQTAAYEKANEALLKSYKLKSQLLKLRENTSDYIRKTQEIETQNNIYEEQKRILAGLAGEEDSRIQRLKTTGEALERGLNTQKQNNLAGSKIELRAQALNTDNGYDEVIKRSSEAADKVAKLNALIKETLYDGNGQRKPLTADQVAMLNDELIKTETDLKRIGAETDTVGNKIKKAFSNTVIKKIGEWILLLGTRALKQVYDNVVKLDKAVTDLQIATGSTREETQKLIESYAKLARQLGATTLEVAEAADTWLRQGYNIAETNQLITYTLMLSKLGQLSSAEAAKALTSAMKGYKVSVEDALGVVDKFTAVDMEAAIGAGDIATAMAETAASAEIAGVSIDKLIGYIATVGEVTQDGAESVGTFYKTLFARMGNVKAGRFVDDETGESLNDVEKVLSNVGILLRDSDGEFRDFGAVLDEVASKWSRYNNVQQHAIATAFAGTRQQEKFIVLMENYGDALDYANTAATSAGTAQQKYQEAYMDSIDAKLNELTASWQEFSATILDSDLIKGGVEFLTGIVEILNTIAGLADGMLLSIPAITVALVALHAILLKIKSTTVFMTMWTHLKGILAVFPAILLGLKSIVLNIRAEAVAHTLSRNALLAKTAATQAATAAQQAMNATNPVGWIILAISAIMGLVKALGKYANKTQAAKEASEKYKEAAENARDAAEESKEETQELVDLVSEYKDIVDGIEDSAAFSAETRQKVLEIQKKITDLVGEEADNYDLLNGKIEDNIKKNMELLATEASGAYEDAIDAYYAAMDSSKHAYETSYKDVGGFNFWGLWGLTDPESYYQIVFQAGKDAEKYAEGVYDIIAGMDERILISRDATIGDKFFGVNLDVDSAQEAVEVLDELLGKMKDAGYRDGNIYKQFNELRERYYSYVLAQNDAYSEVTAAAAMSHGMANYSDGLAIDSLDAYKAYRDKLIEAISKDETILKLGVDEGKIADEVDSWLSLFFGEWYNKFVDATQDAIITKKSFLDILKEIEDEFDLLSKALEEIDERGVLSSETIEKLLEKYEGLSKYFDLTDQGYVIGDAYKDWSTMDILNDYVNSYLQPYVDALASCQEGTESYTIAQENLNNALAVCATLLRTQAIKEATEDLEEQKDAIEEQLSAYKDLINIRKDLLESYKEELDYKNELAKKEKIVADLQTQLTLARLDDSAAGRARARAIEEELTTAKEELNEFTLENAVEKLTQQLDDSYSAYEKFIDKEVTRLEEAIKRVADNVKVTVTAPDPTTGDSVTTVPEHHTGGFVGNFVKLKNNEEFAKLLRGELVLTPAQMDRFMKETLPSIANSHGGDFFEYNAPIFEIVCDSINKESLPNLETIIKMAVERFEKSMRSALSRTGHKTNFNK